MNKNAFYYHYSSLYALAERAIDNTLPRELARMVLLGGGLSGIQLDALAATAPNLEQRTGRVSGSSPARTAQASSPRC